MPNPATLTAPAVEAPRHLAAHLPNAVARPLVTYRLANEAGLFLLRGFQGVSPRFGPNGADVAEFPSEHVAMRVAELLSERAKNLWAAKGGYVSPCSYLPLAWNWSHAPGGWWDGKRVVDTTAACTAQLELGYEPIAPCKNGAGR